jgi:thioredoxin reductase
VSLSDADDVVVVGGGAAGLNAALVFGRARRGVAVIDPVRLETPPPPTCKGSCPATGCRQPNSWPRDGAEVTGYGVELVSDQVLGIDRGFVVRLGAGRTVTARRILMATGVGDELPDVAGVRE